MNQKKKSEKIVLECWPGKTWFMHLYIEKQRLMVE